MLEEKDWCDEDTSHELWQLGLVPDTYYDGPIVLLYEAQKFLIDKFSLYISIHLVSSTAMMELQRCNPGWGNDRRTIHSRFFIISENFKHEYILLEGIKDAIKYIKENNLDK